MKIPKQIPLLFFILIYFNQGINGLSGQCIYYLTREFWHLSATQIGLVGFFGGLAWYIKPILGYFIDKYNQHAKKILLISYTYLIGMYLYIITFGLTLVSLILTAMIINFCIGINDIINDKSMCELERKYELNGALQSYQWGSLETAFVIVALLGAFLSEHFAVHTGYRIAYGIQLIVPIITLFYVAKHYNPPTIKKDPIDFKKALGTFKDSKFLYCIFFVICYQLAPSFGIALNAQMREVLHIDKMFIGYLAASGAVLCVVGYALYNKYFVKWNITTLLYWSIIFSAITNLFYLYIPNQWWLLGYNLAFGVFSGITMLAILSFYARITPALYEGFIYAIITSISNLSGQGSGVLGGFIFDHFGYNTNVIVATFATLLCLFLIPKLEEFTNVNN